MKYGVCLLPVIPLRSEPSETAEQCSQLIFGDTFSIIQTDDSRAYIELSQDGYRGWVDKKQFIEISSGDFFLLTRSKALFAQGFVNLATVTDTLTGEKHIARLPFGARLFSKSYRVGRFMIDAEDVELSKVESFSVEKLMQHISLYLYTPYLWGGKSCFGIDCSGFTQSIFKLFGCALQRDASEQAKQGTPIASLEEAQAGDLAFFAGEQGRITHVGIVLEENKIAHASGRVRIDRLDSKGILRQEDNTYSHNLKQLRRILPLCQ